MSDFDKEAEREKLREKYGDENDDREATEQMSELLLQGATMTNKHCDQCGDPIFRHQGQEFCPTCQVEVGGDSEGSATDEDEGATPPAAEPAETADGSARPASSAGDTSGGATGARPDDSAGGRGTGQRATPGRRTDGEPVRSRPEEEGPARSERASGTVGETQRSLERTLARFARRAEETEDPRAAREHLAAAREAAEALAALRR